MRLRLVVACVLGVALLAGAHAGAGLAAEPPIVIAGPVAQSGIAADLAAGYRNGIALWQSRVNAAGGVRGRPIALQLLDDRSDNLIAREHIEQLVREARADVLIGPYGSAATLGAAALAERSGRVLINGAGPAKAVHKSAPRHVFQIATPYTRYGEVVLTLLRAQRTERLIVLARNDPPAREAAEQLVEDAKRAGIETGRVERFSAGAAAFDTQVGMARTQRVQAWVAFGRVNDAASMVATFRRLNYAPGLFVAQGVAEDSFMARVGQDAEFAIGVSAYEPAARTAHNAQFVAAYRERHGALPDLAAARGYSSGLVIEAALRGAANYGQTQLREQFATLSVDTPIGGYRVDPADGSQRGERMLLVQIQDGRREIVWPAHLATSPLRVPYPAWETRKPL